MSAYYVGRTRVRKADHDTWEVRLTFFADILEDYWGFVKMSPSTGTCLLPLEAPSP